MSTRAANGERQRGWRDEAGRAETTVGRRGRGRAGEAATAGAAEDGDIWNGVDQSLHVVWPPLHKCAASRTMTETGRVGRRTREDRGEARATCVVLKDHAQPYAFPPVRPTLFPHHALPTRPRPVAITSRAGGAHLTCHPGLTPPRPHIIHSRGPREVWGSNSHTHTNNQIDNAPLKVSIALSPTFELVWKLAADPGSRPGSKSRCPRNAMLPSDTAAVTAVEDAEADAAAVALAV